MRDLPRELPRYRLRCLLFAVLLSCAHVLAQQPTNCAQVVSAGMADAHSAGGQKRLALHPGKPLTVDVIFQRGYKGKATEEWPDSAMKDVCEAARYLQEIWSSQEFQSALSGVPELILEADKKGRVVRRISGAELLDELLSKPRILLAVAITSSWTKWYVQPECAESDFLPGRRCCRGGFCSIERLAGSRGVGSLR